MVLVTSCLHTSDWHFLWVTHGQPAAHAHHHLRCGHSHLSLFPLLQRRRPCSPGVRAQLPVLFGSRGLPAGGFSHLLSPVQAHRLLPTRASHRLFLHLGFAGSAGSKCLVLPETATLVKFFTYRCPSTQPEDADLRPGGPGSLLETSLFSLFLLCPLTKFPSILFSPQDDHFL